MLKPRIKIIHKSKNIYTLNYIITQVKLENPALAY
jgi:hypothetical protein